MDKPFGIIVIDGPDGVGKTTLAQKFVDDYGARMFHATYRFKKMIPAYHHALVNKAMRVVSEGGLAVIDRLWVTECVYAAVFRGGTQWPEYTYAIDDRLKEVGALNVLCYSLDPVGAIDRRKQRDAENPEGAEREKPVNGGKTYSDDQMFDLHKRYRDFWYGNMFYLRGDLVERTARSGGARLRPDFVAYRLEEEGRDMDSFCWNAIKRLETLQKQLRNSL